MSSCRNCGNAVFDPVWGEYKCTVYEHVIYDLDNYLDCKSYEKGEPTESKETPEDYEGGDE